jgi:hypothetical protein
VPEWLSSSPERGDHINQSPIGFPVFFAETRDRMAEVCTVEFGVRIDLARQKAFAKRTKGYKSDTKLFPRRHHSLFRLAGKQRILALKGSHWLNGMSAADRLRTCCRKTKVLHFALLDKLLDCARYVFDRNVEVDAVSRLCARRDCMRTIQA